VIEQITNGMESESSQGGFLIWHEARKMLDDQVLRLHGGIIAD